ncbi:Nramp family divalent metal transporter [Nesterenkonia ebinurensis]|uniref:Nramp family divalent metal transporter n=1 Tax=Nesterenkonia ebinurensis TaxID=2608252 RepID=UPI00123E0635|nr:Nramp family divalent metal transporter [Nesterenkonia ebinurensis]
MPDLIRKDVTESPKGPQRFRWYLPALVWMVSSTGSGTVLFTPRVGSQYGYEMLWTALIAITFMWVLINEVGRYTVVTGRSILTGYHDVPGPSKWPVWLVLVPGLAAGVSVIAGVAALAGSAAMVVLPGSHLVYGTIILIGSAVLVLVGRYGGVEKVTALVGGVLMAGIVTTAIVVGPNLEEVGAGLIPRVPSDMDWQFFMPWLGFILAGSGGILWFSYWIAARGFGGSDLDAEGKDEFTETWDPETEAERDDDRLGRLRSWTRMMSQTALIGVVTGGVVLISFLVLGAELLRPEGIMPEGSDVAEDLALLLSDVWGAPGFWFLIVCVILALWGTVLSNQDGWPRTFADALLLLQRKASDHESGLRAKFRHRTFLYRGAVIIAVTAAPLAVLWVVQDPVDILGIGGIVTAVHTPVFVALTLYINHKHLPKKLAPGKVVTTMMVLAGVFYTGFALLFFADLAGIPVLT